MEQKPFIRVDDARLIRDVTQRRRLEENLKKIGWSVDPTELGDHCYSILDQKGLPTGWDYREGYVEYHQMDKGMQGNFIVVSFHLEECIFEWPNPECLGIAIEERRPNQEETIRGAFVIFRNPVEEEEDDGTEAGTN